MHISQRYWDSKYAVHVLSRTLYTEGSQDGRKTHTQGMNIIIMDYKRRHKNKAKSENRIMKNKTRYKLEHNRIHALKYLSWG